MSKITEVICDNPDCGARRGPNAKWIEVYTTDHKVGDPTLVVGRNNSLAHPNTKDYCSISCVARAIEDFINEKKFETVDEYNNHMLGIINNPDNPPAMNEKAEREFAKRHEQALQIMGISLDKLGL